MCKSIRSTAIYFMRIRILAFLFVTAIALICFSACAKKDEDEISVRQTENLIISTTAATVKPTEQENTSAFDDDIDTYIILDNEKTTINGSGAVYENGVLSVTQGGKYFITGVLSDGKIFVNSTDESKKVKLILGGVNVSCSSDAPLYIENSPKETVLILNQGTQNYFYDTEREIPSDVTDYATAAIYSKDDLQIEGEGQLTVTGNFSKGIFSKNDIDIKGGNITVNAADDGIRGKDSVEISAGVLNIKCAGDGIRTSEELEDDKGDITISGGTITVESELDGIQATGKLNISGGTLTVTTAGGSTGSSSYEKQAMDSPTHKFNNPFDKAENNDSSLYTENDKSTKGIKADKSITVSGGIIRLDCSDDSIHSPYVKISGGDLKMSSDDDGIHGDERVTVSGGKIVVTQSYEGVEGRVIDISDGTLIIVSSDDGFNAASSSSTSTTEQASDTAFTFGSRGNMSGMMDYDSSCQITLSGGFVLISAQGDGIDSNGNVNMTGGKLVVFGPTDGGNGALDYGGTFTVSGGTLLAVGSRGMAQSVTGDGVGVLNFNATGSENNVYAVTDSQDNCIIGFTAQKRFENVVFASDRISADGQYSFSDGGNISEFTDSIYGIYFDGVYKR